MSFYKACGTLVSGDMLWLNVLHTKTGEKKDNYLKLNAAI